jgi:hypothetical protein
LRRALVERGQLVFSNWTAANLISQVLWGALFALPFGATYTVLRSSTLVIALAGAIALFRILRDSDCPLLVATLGAFIFLFNPLSSVLSVTFMTDIPYAAMQTIAIFLLLASTRSHLRWQNRLGWAVAVAALLCRQVGMAIPLGYGAARVSQIGFRWRTILPAVTPVAVFVAIQVLYQNWLKYAGLKPAVFNRQISLLASDVFGTTTRQIATDVTKFIEFFLYYFGLFLLPLTLIVAALFTQTLSRRNAISLWAGIGIAAIFITWLGPKMPVWRETIRSWTLGVDVDGVPPVAAFWPIVTLFSALGVLLLILTLALSGRVIWRNSIKRESSPVQIFAATVVIALLGATALVPPMWRFERYIVPVIPCLVVLVCVPLRMETTRQVPRVAIWVSAICMFAMAMYSVLGTHDYLAEKRVRWEALQDLIQKNGILPENVDAGWVYNAPNSYGVYGSLYDEHSWFKTQDFQVVAALNPGRESFDGFSLVKIYPINRWAPWSSAPGSIVVLHRIGQPSGPYVPRRSAP